MVSFHSNPKERQCQTMFKLTHNCTHLICQQSNDQNSPSRVLTVREPRMLKLDLEKAEESEFILRSPTKKTSTSAVLTMPKPLTVWITTNCGSFLKRWEFQTTLPASWEICMQVKKQQLELHMAKEYVNAVYCHPAYYISMQSTSYEMLGWMKHKLESRMLGEIPITSDMQMTPPLWQKVKKN